MTVPRVVCTGWRDWPESNKYWIWQHLDDTILIVASGDAVIVHGQCPKGGADLWVEQWAHARGMKVERHPADWDRYGKAAGPKRNTLMVSLGVNVCYAFPGPGSRGTWDCMQKASEAGAHLETLSFAEVLRLQGLGVRPECTPDV